MKLRVLTVTSLSLLLSVSLASPSYAGWENLSVNGFAETDATPSMAGNGNGQSVGGYVDPTTNRVYVDRTGTVNALHFYQEPTLPVSVSTVVDAAGNSCVAWMRKGVSSSKYGLYVGCAKADGGFGSPKRVSPKAANVGSYDLVIVKGTVTLTWALASATSKVSLRKRSASGAWSPVKVMSGKKIAYRPTIDSAANGRLTLVYLSRVDGIDRVTERHQRRDGSWTAPKLLSDSSDHAEVPTLKVVRNGTAMIAWAYQADSGNAISGRHRTKFGKWTSEESIALAADVYNLSIESNFTDDWFVVTFKSNDGGGNWSLTSVHRNNAGVYGTYHDVLEGNLDEEPFFDVAVDNQQVTTIVFRQATTNSFITRRINNIDGFSTAQALVMAPFARGVPAIAPMEEYRIAAAYPTTGGSTPSSYEINYGEFDPFE